MVARTWLRATVASLIVAATLMLSATTAEAGLNASPVPDFLTTTTVGESFTGAVFVVNNSFGVEATQPVTVQSLTLAPACMQFIGANCAGGIDVGVFTPGPTGTGTHAFAGIVFSISQTSPGLYTFTPSAPLSLDLGEIGGILFQVTTVRAPTVDVVPITPGIQTNALATATITSPLSTFPAIDMGYDTVTVHRASPSLVTQASTVSNNVAPGTAVTDTATVIPPPGSPAPTGTVTYTLVGPNPDATCTAPMVGASTTPLGSPSAPFTVTAPGVYNFLATYSGDANYNPVGPVGCGDPAERFIVALQASREAVADFDGNAATDVSVYRPSTGVWYVQSPFSWLKWGEVGDIPIPGDYDGNGTTEFAVYRPGTGVWYLYGPPFRATHWGETGDIPVPGDYDGNGTTDVAVYRPSTGVWYVQSPFNAVKWGGPGDVPVPGDYDGNGSTEFAVYRPSTGVWYLYGPPFRATKWGETGDIPLPLPHAIYKRFF